ncbi:MFS general substrate transporter [Microthyrium microscopicum]|uniref:MFS general substrate transporter n=1 Tax=Microthyrium microscopicum TaxID=703497 RepID=A0A6A6TZ54_9PEZI|nr:MFS general substrate transporter [Microthyrium microscopicum]
MPSKHEKLVDFDGNGDPLRPINWPMRKKVVTTVLYGMTTAIATWLSSIYTSASQSISTEFHISPEVSTLGVTLFLFGFGLGPLLWAPMSEAYGRKIAVLPPLFVSACFVFGTAAAKDIQTILITRFFAGFFSAAPVTNTGGVLRDIWSNEQRGVAVLGYSASVNMAPLLSPIVGAALVQSSLGWRWTHYLTGILMLALLGLDLIFLDETYDKVILVRKAEKLRKETGDWALHARHEEDLNMADLVHKFLARPFQLLLTPICFLMVLYASFVYGIVFLNFSAFDIEYAQIRGWSPVNASLPLLSILVGCAIGGVVCYYNQGFYTRHLHANNDRAVPEARLPPMMIGSVSLAAGLFIFAWTSSPNITWVASCVGGALMGLGFFGIFQGTTNYLVDTFGEYGASAIGAQTLMRNIFAGSFPLFTRQMFGKLGIDWGVSLLGFIAVVMIPIPFLFYLKGKMIRARGAFSRESDD